MHVGCPAIDSPANSLPSSFFKRLLELIEETMDASPDQQHFRSSYKVVPFEAVKTVFAKIWYPHSFFLVDRPWHASSKAGGVGSVACGDLAASPLFIGALQVLFSRVCNAYWAVLQKPHTLWAFIAKANNLIAPLCA